MPDPKTLAALRTLVSAWTPPDRRARDGVVTGIAAIDDALGGGLPTGQLTELVAPGGAGGQLVLASLLESARAGRQRIALIDASDGFAPEAMRADALRHLVWARCHGLGEALAVADVLARDGNYAAVVLDLRDIPAAAINRTSKSLWHRLHRVAERQPGAVAVFTRQPTVPAVRWRLVLHGRAGIAERRMLRRELGAALTVERARGHWHGEMTG